MSLVVTVEVHPHGDASQAKEIARVVIANVTGLADISAYDVCCTDAGGMAETQVVAHPRRAGWLTLATRAFLQLESGARRPTR